MVWLLPPYGPRFASQRRALAALYQSLAAASVGAGSDVASEAAPFTAARHALDLLPQFSQPAAAAMFGLLGEAERIRRALHTVRVTAAAGNQKALVGAAQVLGSISRTVASGRERLPGLLAEWLRVQDRLLPELLTGYADVGAADLAAVDALRARSRQVRERMEAAVGQSHAEPAEHRGPWSSRQLERIRAQVSTVAGCATLLGEHLPRTSQETVPELTELADLLHEHLTALARAAAGAETVAPGALRSVYDSFTARSGLPAERSDGFVSAATGRAVALSTATVEALTATIASRHRPGRHTAA